MEQFKENYKNQNERMNPQLEDMLKSMQSDLANNPAFPKTDANGNPINFVELIAYKRFLDVIEKVKMYTNLQNVTGGGLQELSSMLMQGVKFIQQVEAPHKQELENLAVDLVVEEMEIPDGAFQFQCKLVPVGSINQDGFQKDAEEPNEEEINQAFKEISKEVEIPADELFEDEKHKRRFINMLIQGSSKKGHYMFELVRRKVNEYNPNLAETYGKVMSINDLIYWLLDDESIKQMASSSSSMAGKEEIEEGEDGDTIIKTEAICFPVSLHEIIKGVMEVFGSQGLPDDPQQATLVIDSVDSLSNETMDLRLGVPCWEKIYGAYPDFILEEGNRYLQSYLFARYCALPTDEFFRVSRLILSDDPKGAKYFEKMVDEIQNDLQREDYQKNIDDVNLDDLLGFAMGGRIGKWKKSKTMIFPTKEEAEKRLAFLENYDSLRNIQMKKLENGYVIFFEHLVIDDDYGKDTTQYRIRKLKLNQNRGFEGYKLPDDFKKGGGVEKGYNVFNYTDNVYATDEVFKTKKLANEFIKEFRNRFSRQGYYRDNQMNKIAIEDIDLLAIPTDFSPFRKFNGGGGVNSNYGKFGDDNSNLVNFDIDNLDAFEFRQYENFSKSLSKAQALQVLINDVEGDYSQLSEELSKIAEEQMPMDNYNNGGMIDLFQDYENIPPQVEQILDRYADEFGGDGSEMDYKDTANMLKEIEAVGYTFDYYLNNEPYGLRPIGVKITELQGYEDFDDSDKFADGGQIIRFDRHASMDSATRNELVEMTSYPFLLEYEVEENGQIKYDRIKSELKREGVSTEMIKNYLSGLFDGYNYSNTDAFKKEMAKLKIADKEFYDKVMMLYEKISKYPKINREYEGGGEAEFDVYNWDDKMALINLGQIYEYAIELDKIIDENTDLEEWVKMKLTRIEQNIADVKHSLEGWEKYSSGGEIAKKQLLHIAKYSKDLIEMISNGSKLMSWQEGKLSVSAQSIDDIYHHLDYKMGNRAVDLENESGDKYGKGRQVKVVDFNPKSEKEYDIKEFTEIAIKKYSKQYDVETIKKEINRNKDWYDYTNKTQLNNDLRGLLENLRILEVIKKKIKYTNKKYKINDTFNVEFYILFNDEQDAYNPNTLNKPSGYYLQFMTNDVSEFDEINDEIFDEINTNNDKKITISYDEDALSIIMPLFETKSETPTNYKKAIQEGKNKISVLTEYFVEFLDEFNDSYYGDEESEDEYGRGRQVVKKTPNKTKQVNKYVVKGYVYDGGEIWKETFDNIDEAYELAYQIQNGWTDDGTYRLITIYDEKGKKVATISDDKYFNELTEHKLFKKVYLGADTKKERQVENEKLKGYKFNLQIRIADGGATGIFEKTFDSIFEVMDKAHIYYEEDYYARINDESLDYWEDKYYEIELSRNYIKGKYGWSFIKENGYWIAKDDYDNNHIVRIVNGKPTSDSSITKGALKQIMELEAQKKYSEKPKHNKSLSDMKKIWDGLSDNYKERENIVFLIGYSGGQLREVVPYKFNDFDKSFQIQIMNAYFGQTEEQKQKIINKNRKEHEELVKNYPKLRNLYGKKFVDGGEAGQYLSVDSIWMGNLEAEETEYMIYDGYAIATNVENGKKTRIEFPKLNELTKSQINKAMNYRFGSDWEAEGLKITPEDVMMSFGKIIGEAGIERPNRRMADGGGVEGNTARTYDGINSLRSYQKSNIEDIQEYIADNGTIIEFVAMNNRDSSSGMTFAITINGRGLYSSDYRENAMQVYKDEIAKYKGNKFGNGGDVQGWMKEALLNLQLVEDDNSLQITYTNEDSFYVEGDSAEYRVFETYAIAYNTAIEQVREDLEENPDYFNQDWLMNWVDMDDSIENILEEYYRSYADDIAFEDDSTYNNRLIAEMVANGLMTEEEATSEDADDIAEDNVDNLVDLYVEENMEGDKGVEWYISNFGQDDFRDLVIDNNLIDISGASEDAVDTDGVAHFLSSYDGEEIELDNDVVAYRTN